MAFKTNWPYATSLSLVALLVLYSLSIYFVSKSVQYNGRADVYDGSNYAVQGINIYLTLLLAYFLYWNFTQKSYAFVYSAAAALIATTALSIYFVKQGTVDADATNSADVTNYALSGVSLGLILVVLATVSVYAVQTYEL